MIPKITHSQLQQELPVYVEAQTAMFIWGTFGIGKSDAVRQFCIYEAARRGLEFSDKHEDINNPKKFNFLPIILHQYEPAELKGLPFPNEQRDATVYLPMGLLPNNPDTHGIIFLDEFSQASEMLKNNGYQVVQDRRLGYWRCPDGYGVIAASNLQSDRGFSDVNPPALNNRFLHVELMVPQVQDDGDNIGWMNGYAVKNNVHFDILSYLLSQEKMNQSKLHMYNDKEWSDDKVCCATPRMWKKVSDILRVAEKTGPLSEERMIRILASGVGTGVATDLVAWKKMSTEYDIDAIYKNHAFKMPSAHDIAKIYSLLAAIVGYYIHKPTEANAVRLLQIAMDRSTRDYTLIMLNQARNSNTDFFAKVKKQQPAEWAKFAKELFPLLI